MSLRRSIFPLILAFLCTPVFAGVLAQNNILVEYQPDDLELAQRSMDVLIQASSDFSKRLPMGKRRCALSLHTPPMSLCAMQAGFRNCPLWVSPNRAKA